MPADNAAPLRLVTTRKGQVAHVSEPFGGRVCGALNRAAKAGNVVPVDSAYALANLVPCTRCVSPSQWRLFRRWAA